MSCGCGCAAGGEFGKDGAIRSSPGGTARVRRARAGESSSASGSPRGLPVRPPRTFRARVRALHAAPRRIAAGRRAGSTVTALVAVDRSEPSNSSSDSLSCSTAASSTGSPAATQMKNGFGTEPDRWVADAGVCGGAKGPGFVRTTGAGTTSAQVRIQTHARHTGGVDRSTSASGDTGAKCEGRLRIGYHIHAASAGTARARRAAAAPNSLRYLLLRCPVFSGYTLRPRPRPPRRSRGALVPLRSEEARPTLSEGPQLRPGG